MMTEQYPAFGICGYSGSGKTTVIEKLIRNLVQRGLKIGIIKHDVHGLNIDQEGKDTDRFFKAGADVIIRGPEQSFLRTHRRGDMELSNLLKVMGPYFDLVLVEGHKGTPLPQKVWLSGEDGDLPPDGVTGIQRVLRRDEDRLQIVMDMIDEWLPVAWKANPVYAGILIGGDAQGRDDRHLERMVAQVREHVDDVILLGAGPIPSGLDGVPVLCDAQDADGPLAGMLAAARWRPLTSWLFLSSDLESLSGDAIQWLLNQRKPGTWAVMPVVKHAPCPEPLLAYYDFRSLHLLEEVQKPVAMAGLPGVSMPEVPEKIQGSWCNVNTKQDFETVRKEK